MQLTDENTQLEVGKIFVKKTHIKLKALYFDFVSVYAIFYYPFILDSES